MHTSARMCTCVCLVPYFMPSPFPQSDGRTGDRLAGASFLPRVTGACHQTTMRPVLRKPNATVESQVLCAQLAIREDGLCRGPMQQLAGRHMGTRRPPRPGWERRVEALATISVERRCARKKGQEGGLGKGSRMAVTG